MEVYIILICKIFYKYGSKCIWRVIRVEWLIFDFKTEPELSGQKFQYMYDGKFHAFSLLWNQLYFNITIIWITKRCRVQQQAEPIDAMDADYPNPFSFNYDDVIFKVQTLKNS